MKRSSTILLSVFVCALSANAQQRKPTPTPCPPGVTDIRNCPVKGCASGVKGKLNEKKNIRSPDGSTPTLRTVQWWKELKNPRGGGCWDREKLRALGEGEMMMVVAWALAARAEGPETCNCYLGEPKDTGS